MICGLRIRNGSIPMATVRSAIVTSDAWQSSFGEFTEAPLYD
jgi:hypothetical protein